jgi:hypothetical protein
LVFISKLIRRHPVTVKGVYSNLKKASICLCGPKITIISNCFYSNPNRYVLFQPYVITNWHKTWVGYDAWEKNKEGGRCQTYTSKEKSESIYFSDTIRNPFIILDLWY